MRTTLTHHAERPRQPDDPWRWLIGLRWIAAASQAVLLGVMRWVYHLPFPTVELLAVIAVLAGSNLGLALRRPSAHQARMGAVLVFDVVLLTALLSLSGGPFNPFSVFYLVHVALAAVLLDGAWAIGLAVFSSVAFGLLFFITPESGMHVLHHGPGFLVHLRGMWAAYVLAAAATATFVARQARALREREQELSALRERTTRSDKIAALHTLAAGAAHELGTPLGTIALITGELRARAGSLDEGQREDLRLVAQEVARCRAILQRMTGQAGGPHGEAATRFELGALADELHAAFPTAALAVDAERHSSVLLPRAAVVQVLGSLLQNALQASPEQSEVHLQMEMREAALHARVVDRGAGMPHAVLERLGEPFFTTKEPGEGMGLGLFLARTITEHLGGELSIESSPRAGTTVSLRLPCGVGS